MRVVLDSNVYIAAVKGKGRCSEVFAVCAARHTLAVSELLLAEVRRALLDRLKVPATDFEDFEALLHDVATWIEPTSIEPDICPTPTTYMCSASPLQQAPIAL